MGKDKKRIARSGRHDRVRQKVKGTDVRPRLCVYRSLQHIYAQVIDDIQGHTMAAASTLDADLRSEKNGKNKAAQSELVGSLIAKKAKDAGIKQVVFDRGGYKYHGRVKKLAEAARKGGLKF